MGIQIKDVLMSYDTDVDNDVQVSGFVIQWESHNEYGFGNVGIHVNWNNEVEIDTESMGKEFFLDLMSKLYDMAEVK